MDPDTPGTNYDASAPGPAKRKRGRPLNGSQLHPVGSVPTSNDITIGQVVSGFIEASFDGGYLLTLKAGNSETTMRGVVFKHGRYVPVSSENDVAPDVKMIKRCEIAQQRENLCNLHAAGGHSREKNGAAHHPLSFSPTLMSSGAKPLPPVSTQVTCPTPLRGNAMPVLLQQVTPANGLLVSNHSHPIPIQDAGLSSVGTHTPPVPILGSHTLNGSTLTKPSGNQDPVSTAEAQNQSVGEGSLSGVPFENLMTEVSRRIQHPTLPDGNQNEISLLIGNSNSTHDDEVSDADDQPLYVEPLQTRQPVLTSNPNLIPLQLDNDRSAKITQLFQENATGNVLSQNQTPPPPSNPI
ncbi:hypothetical protein MLD38_022069 [Melastoma candidum]|uniref:Uncharacterized protein n=1 Tax=Melastoma candidum TaxID=119954 RepID=A0ACB9QLH0_9MYRT|nr:hypothetical protein MLD38_022069 [Melastoma candidum]